MESSSELLKEEEKDEERKKLLDTVIHEITLFNLKERMDNIPSKESDPPEANEESADSAHLVGITFFESFINCKYDPEMIKPNHHLEILSGDILSKSPAIYSIELADLWTLNSDRVTREVFDYFFRLLFTSVTEVQLSRLQTILVLLINRYKCSSSLIKLALDAMPDGMHNLGGNVKAVYSMEMPPIAVRETKIIKLPNLEQVIDTLRLLFSKYLKSGEERRKFIIPVNQVDDLVFIWFAVAHDPEIINSTLIPIIRVLLHAVLELYSPEINYLSKVQDLVERFGIYWDDVGRFDGHVASHITATLLPFSQRGIELRTSLAYYAFMCCFNPNEANILDVVELPMLISEIGKNMNVLKELKYSSLYCAFRLADLAIARPIIGPLEEFNLLIELMDQVQCSKSQIEDLFNSSKISILIKHLEMECRRMHRSNIKSMKQLTIDEMFLPQETDSYGDYLYFDSSSL